jgi:hypothetical protein
LFLKRSQHSKNRHRPVLCHDFERYPKSWRGIGAGRVYLAGSDVPEHATCSLNTSVVDFTAAGSATAILAVTTRASSDARRLVTPPGRYALTVTAISLSGDASRLSVPLTVS